MAEIREVKVEQAGNGKYKGITVAFGPHYFVEILDENGRINFYLGATHHGFRADASEIGGELERLIQEIRHSHPESIFD